MAKASEKNKGPRPVEIAIAAVLSCLLGVVGAIVLLAFQAPEEVTELPPEEDREFGRVYHVQGKKGNASHGTWEAKTEAIKAKKSGKISLVEEELNQWASRQLKETDAVEKPALHIEPGTPNFKIGDDELFVGAPLTWNIFGSSRTFESHTRGHFAAEGDSFVFEHGRIYVGSCPLPDLGGLATRLFRDVADSYNVSESLREGWANLESVSIEEGSLKLVIP